MLNKKFNYELFRQKTDISMSELKRKNPIKFSKKRIASCKIVSSILSKKITVCSPDEAKKDLKKLKTIFSKKLYGFLDFDGAENLYLLIQRSSGGDPELETTLILDFIELTDVALLKSPSVAQQIYFWKVGCFVDELKRLSHIFKPGHAAKGKANRSHARPLQESDELFAMMRDSLGRSFSQKLTAAHHIIRKFKIKGKRLGRDLNADYLVDVYDSRLKHFQSYLTEKEIDEAVKASLK